MPWKTSDVEKFNSGLTPTKKRQWVEVANSVLKKCMEEGGSEETCAGKAVRQANGVVQANQLAMYDGSSVTGYTPRTEMLDEQECIIVPVVMMVEGVHNGSHGAIYHSPAHFGQNPEQWNGVPITCHHPTNPRGVYISANSEGVEHIGVIKNARMKDQRLTAEAWLYTTQLANHTDIQEAIQNRLQLDVSVGTYNVEVEQAGTWNNESYVAMATQYRPDHLAILPGGTGACSWNDGCGIRVNENNKQKEIVMERSVNVNTLKTLAKKGFVVMEIEVNEQSLTSVIEQLRAKVDSWDDRNINKYHYVRDVFPTYFVYIVRQPQVGERLYKQAYEFNEETGQVDLIDSPTEVRAKTEYIDLAANSEIFNNSLKKEDKMVKPCCAEKVTELINHQYTSLRESDREWLETLEEIQILALFPKDIPAVNAEKVDKNRAIEVLKAEKPSMQEVMELLSAEDKAVVDAALTLHTEKRSKMIESIMTNADAGWSKTELEALSTEMLEKISKTSGAVVDYSAKPSPPATGEKGKVEPMLPAGV